jgi:hypothetical protein
MAIAPTAIPQPTLPPKAGIRAKEATAALTLTVVVGVEGPLTPVTQEIIIITAAHKVEAADPATQMHKAIAHQTVRNHTILLPAI